MRRFEITDLRPWIEVRFDRASGPGGQNVNKVSTRATLRLDFRACPLLTSGERVRIAQHCATRLTRDGRLRIVSQQARTQAANRAAAESRMLELLHAALHVSKPRRPTRPTAAAQARRLGTKKRRGEIKQTRRPAPQAGD